MKTIRLTIVVSFLVLSGLALAAQPAEQKDHSSMMQEMMKDGEKADHQDRMMRMMKMMDQCASLMESAQAKDRKNEPSQPK